MSSPPSCRRLGPVAGCEHPNHSQNIEEYAEVFGGVQDQYVETKRLGRLCGVCAALEAENLLEEAENM